MSRIPTLNKNEPTDRFSNVSLRKPRKSTTNISKTGNLIINSKKHLSKMECSKQLLKKSKPKYVAPTENIIEQIDGSDSVVSSIAKTGCSRSDLAALKICWCIIVNAWRKYREEVHFLKSECEKLMQNNYKLKNQIRLSNNIINFHRIKHKESQSEIKSQKYTIDNLSHNLINEKYGTGLLSGKVDLLKQENESINLSLRKTQEDNQKLCEIIKQLEENVKCEQNYSLTLRNEGKDLLGKVELLNFEKDEMKCEYEEKTTRLKKEYNKNLSEMEIKLQRAQVEILEYKRLDTAQRDVIQSLSLELNKMEKEVSSSLINVLSNLFADFPQKSVWLLKLFRHVIIPEFPPPQTYFPYEKSTKIQYEVENFKEDIEIVGTKKFNMV